MLNYKVNRTTNLINNKLNKMESFVEDILRRATSQDPAIFRPASQELQGLEMREGFHASLVVCVAGLAHI